MAHTLLVSWLSGFLFLGTLHWLDGGGTLVLVVFFFWNCSFFMSFGLVRGCLWRKLILGILDQGVQFQCRLFPGDQALIFAALVVLLLCIDEVSLLTAWWAW